MFAKTVISQLKQTSNDFLIYYNILLLIQYNESKKNGKCRMFLWWNLIVL